MCIKKFIKKMIEIGNNVITAITIGSNTPSKIDVGSTQVWPDGSADYIILNNYSARFLSSGSNYAYVNVTSASTTAWTATTTDSWITLSKVNSSRLRYDITQNSGAERTGTIVFQAGTATANFEVSQVGQPQHDYVLNAYSSPTSIPHSGTTLKIYVTSTKDGEPQEVSYIMQENGQTPTWVHFLQRQQVTGEDYNYVYYFAIPTNDKGSPRSVGFVFTQDGSGLQKTLSITQAP